MHRFATRQGSEAWRHWTQLKFELRRLDLLQSKIVGSGENTKPIFAMTQRPDTSLQIVTVYQSDVDNMLDCYDSGMFDVSTSNAVALALQRRLKPDHRVQVIRDSNNHECCVRIGDFRSRLPEKLIDWLNRAERASPVEPISFWVDLPKDDIVVPAVEIRQEPIRSEQVSLVS